MPNHVHLVAVPEMENGPYFHACAMASRFRPTSSRNQDHQHSWWFEESPKKGLIPRSRAVLSSPRRGGTLSSPGWSEAEPGGSGHPMLCCPRRGQTGAWCRPSFAPFGDGALERRRIPRVPLRSTRGYSKYHPFGVWQHRERFTKNRDTPHNNDAGTAEPYEFSPAEPLD